MSDGESNVTFVGGKAVEQTESLGSNLSTDERDAAKDAVRKAMEAARSEGEKAAEEASEGKARDPFKPPGAKASKDDDTGLERDENGRFVAKEDKPSKAIGKPKNGDSDGSEEEESEEELDIGKVNVKQLLKQREKVANLKLEAKDEISKGRAELQAQQEEFLKSQRLFQQQQADFARQYEALQSLRKDPARAIKALGYDPEQFIMDLATDGTPEGNQRRQNQELQNALNRLKAFEQEQVRSAQRAQQQMQEQQVLQYRANQVNQFLGMSRDEEKYPHIAHFYSGNERSLVAFGDIVAQEFRQLTRGREASLPDILEYIEDELADRTTKFYTKNQQTNVQVSERKVSKGSDSSSKPKSSGKTLNPKASSERSSLTAKDLQNLDQEDRLEAARQAVKVAMANSSKE